MKIITMLLIMGILSGCGKSADGAEKVVDSFLTAVKNNDFAEAGRYLDEGDKEDYIALANQEELKKRLKDLDYRVVSSERREDSVYVTVEITSPENLELVVEVEEDDGRWQIDSDYSLVNALFGNTTQRNF